MADSDNRQRPTATRIAIWVIVGAVGIYLVVSGVLGIIAKGG
jgi:hypothetical protein